MPKTAVASEQEEPDGKFVVLKDLQIQMLISLIKQARLDARRRVSGSSLNSRSSLPPEQELIRQEWQNILEILEGSL